MVIFPPSFSPPSGASKVASPLSVSKAFLDLARLTAPLSFLSLFPLSFSCLRCLQLNPIFHWLPPLKPLVTSCAMLLRKPGLPTPGSSLMVFLSSLQSMFFQLTARSFFNLTLPSCALSSPTAPSCGAFPVTIPKFVPFLRPVGLLSMTNQQGGHAGFTILATCLARACLQIFTGDREQTRAGTGGDLLRESLLQRLANKGIGFLDGPPPKLPSEMLTSFASALADESSFPLLGTSGPDPFPLLSALTTQVLPPSCHPKTVRAAEGHVPTAGVLLHLILPHSLRCPADAYLTQVAMHYPHLHRPSGPGVAYGHYEEPPRQIRDSRLPVDMQGRTHPISGYRLVHWSPDLKPGPSNHMDQSSRDSVLTVAAVLSYSYWCLRGIAGLQL